jgi:sugar/nucleoside kinase (ribokinase family)
LEANKELLNGVSVLLLNREETLMLHGKPEDIRYDWVREELLYKELLLSLRSVGVKIPVITDGFRGAHALDGDDYLFCPTFSVKVVSTLGAGDAFGSTLVRALERHGDVGRALLEATANSASVIQGMGAKKRLLSVEGIEKFLSEYNTSDQKNLVKVVRKSVALLGSTH